MSAHEDMVDELEDLSKLGFDDIKSYFTNSAKSQDIGDRVDRALKVVSTYSRVRATRANEMAISVSVAKTLNLGEEALTPIFETLTGINPKKALPAPKKTKK